MHEVRATLPPEWVPEAVRLAKTAGIERVTVTDAFVHGLERDACVISAETSTPKARAFIQEFLASPALAEAGATLTSRELRAVVSDAPSKDLTSPMSEPFPDVIQDLSQLSTLTASYLARAMAGAIILATGVLHNDPIAIVVAALFLPFLSQVLAISFGIWSGDWKLARQGTGAVLASTVAAVLAGVLVGAIEGGPILFSTFKGPLASIAISTAIGITAGLSCADDAGRRYLIGVAGAVQFAVFPVWLGLALATGLPPWEVAGQRLLSFAINLATVSATAAMAYASLQFRSGWKAPRRDRMPR